MTIQYEYSKGFHDGYYKAVHSIYISLRESRASQSTRSIASPIQGILDGLEIILRDYNK